jgi:type I restriction-modification system DNA methylase subunit
MSDIDSFREKLQAIITKFEKDKPHYLSKGYPEAQVRIDFINPFFKALGWDIENKAQKPPHERDVIVELSPEITRRPDYNFRINGVTKFFVEAKAPSIALDNVMHILQAKSYAWSTKEVYFVVLTDFEEFKLYDASLKPNPRFPNEGLIFDFKYTDYLSNIEKLWELSKERVEQGSLEALLPRDTKSKRLRIPPDKSFLEDLTIWRTELAKDIHKRNPDFDVKLLNDVVQKLLDRIIFIRIAEDRRIRPDRELWDIVAQWKEEAKRKPIMSHLVALFHEVNDDLNGDIFKSHACEQTELDSALLADIIENLYFPKSRYRFDAIGVELLGSIYERYLGSTIRVTPQRVKVEEKPEVRKAGGVYYTPKYIVDYIVKNTVGKVIEGKTPRQIEKIKILDPACGSGSFLLGAYQYLIDYHLRYYRDHPKEAQTQFFDFYYKVGSEDLVLPLRTKAAILRNNIFGVDIDPQAVEITMMSLYLKALEGERSLLPKKQHLLPPLSNNIKCGNSLIGYDIYDTPSPNLSHQGRGKAEGSVSSDTKVATHNSHISPDRETHNTPLPLEGGGLGRGWDDETKSRINPFEWNSKSTGFGEIMENGGFDVVISNPPWGGLIETVQRGYFERKYASVTRELETHLFFMEKGVTLLNNSGVLSYILPNTFMYVKTSEPLRNLLLTKCHINELTELAKYVFENAPDIVPTIVNLSKASKSEIKKRFTLVRSFVDRKGKLYPEDLNIKGFSKINQTAWMETEDSIFNIFLITEVIQILAKIRMGCSPLGDVASISYGIKTGDNAKFLSEKKLNDSYRKALKTKEVERFSIKWAGLYLNYSSKLAGYRTQNVEVPKIIVQYIRKLSLQRRLICGFDAKGEFYPLNNYSYIEAKDLDLRYILGIMNSSLLNFYFRTKFIDYNIKPYYLSQLPIKKTPPYVLMDKLIALVESMLELHKRKNSLLPSAEREKIEREIIITDEKIDEIVYGLYGITDEEKKIIASK